MRSALPVIDMIGAVAERVATLGYVKIGILGTRTVMASRFYCGIDTAEVIAPPEPMCSKAHNTYVSMATIGSITPDQQRAFETAARHLVDEAGAQAIMLGGPI